MNFYNMTPELILASASPRRREILDRMGIPFRVHPADVEERNGSERGPEEMVLWNARLKTEAVAAIFPDRVVLGADTSVFLDGRVFNKPGTREEASFMLGQLSGNTHTVVTGLWLVWKNRQREWHGAVRSEVVFRRYDWETVKTYLDAVNPLDKAGAYGIQERGDLLVASYRGSYTNIMGLPAEETASALEAFGVPVPPRGDPDRERDRR